MCLEKKLELSKSGNFLKDNNTNKTHNFCSEAMTSTVLQQHHTTPTTIRRSKTATIQASMMGWSNEKLKFSCVDNISLKQLWKLIALDTNASNTNNAAKANNATADSCNGKTKNACNNNNEVCR